MIPHLSRRPLKRRRGSPLALIRQNILWLASMIDAFGDLPAISLVHYHFDRIFEMRSSVEGEIVSPPTRQGLSPHQLSRMSPLVLKGDGRCLDLAILGQWVKRWTTENEMQHTHIDVHTCQWTSEWLASSDTSSRHLNIKYLLSTFQGCFGLIKSSCDNSECSFVIAQIMYVRVGGLTFHTRPRGQSRMVSLSLYTHPGFTPPQRSGSKRTAVTTRAPWCPQTRQTASWIEIFHE